MNVRMVSTVVMKVQHVPILMVHTLAHVYLDTLEMEGHVLVGVHAFLPEYIV